MPTTTNCSIAMYVCPSHSKAWKRRGGTTLDPSSDCSRWFVLMNGDDPIAIGGLQVINRFHGDAVLPVFVARHARRQGLAKALMARLLEFAFETLGLFRVTTYLRADNDVSRRLTASVGFAEEGLLRQSWVAGGRRYDTIVLGILASEWDDRRPHLVKLFQGIDISSAPDTDLR